MKKCIFFLVFLFSSILISQNKQVLYDFADLPQTLLLNPASENEYKFHIGVPFLSGFSADVSSSGAVLADAFAIDNRNINDKVSTILHSLSTRDFVKINVQMEVINAGFRIDKNTYISFGFYEEVDGIGYVPKDLLILFTEGNSTNLNKNFSAAQLLYKLDVLGVLHAGISRKINERLTVGGRFKLYSSALNIESSNNTGTFTTVRGANNIYTHYFNDINITAKSAGIIDANRDYIEDVNTHLKNTFLGGNLGIGLDFGLTHHISPQLEFSASLLDVGFIYHKKNVDNVLEQGDFIFEGIEIIFDPNSSADYWGDINRRFQNQLKTTENQDSYISWRPTKLNAALKYSFGEKRSDICYDNSYKDFYTDALGVQFYSILRPLGPQLAITGFYQKSITKKLHTKLTYTIDDFSYSNIGAGLSAQFGKLNVYGMMDNLLEYSNLSAANSLSLQVGINLIVN
jgi:hypothetical protein